MPKDSHDNKNKRIMEELNNLAESGENGIITPTAFSKKVGMHVGTSSDRVDLIEAGKGIGFRVLRDKDGTQRLYQGISDDEELNLEKIADKLKELDKKINILISNLVKK